MVWIYMLMNQIIIIKGRYMKKKYKILKIFFLLICILLIIIFSVKFISKNKYNKEILKGNELLDFYKINYKNNIKNNSKPKMKKMIEKNTKSNITNEYLGNYPNGKNSVIIKIKIKDKTYSMGEIIKITPEKLLSSYLDYDFKKVTTAKHENGKLSYMYFEMLEKNK